MVTTAKLIMVLVNTSEVVKSAGTLPNKSEKANQNVAGLNTQLLWFSIQTELAIGKNFKIITFLLHIHF